MPGFAPDTSCMIAAVCSWHEDHDVSHHEIERRLRQGEPMLVPGPALIEAYAVLTRLPPPHRLAPADALALLESSFVELGRIVVLEPDGYVALIHDAPAAGIAGGRTYDAVIAACAIKAKASTILTLNEGHFSPFARPGLEIVAPKHRR